LWKQGKSFLKIGWIWDPQLKANFFKSGFGKSIYLIAKKL
jgi:hypothetical protein